MPAMQFIDGPGRGVVAHPARTGHIVAS